VPTFTPVAALAAAALVLLVACGGSDGTEANTVRRGDTTSTTSSTLVAPPDTAGGTSTTAPGAPAGSGGGSRPAGGSGSSGRAPAPGNGALAPAPAGTYNYDTSGVATLGLGSVPFPAVTTLVVDPPNGSRQHATRNLRDAAGKGLVQEMVLDFRGDGVFIDNLKLTTAIAGTTNSLDLRPTGQALFLPTGAGPGAHSEFDMTDGAMTARVVVDVLGREQVPVAGRSVDALVLRAVATLPGPDISGRVELNYSFAPSVRLPVKERVVSDASAAGGLVRFHSEYSATIQRLP
jgi:hypothetical protein